MKYAVLLMLTFLTANLSFSQSEKVSRAELEKEKQVFITKALSLSDEETTAFWPVYAAYEQEVKTLRLQKRKIKHVLKNGEVLSGDEKYKLVEKSIYIERQEADVKLKYLGIFSSKIGKSKAAAVFKAEDDFKRVLFRKLKDLPPPPPPPKP